MENQDGVNKAIMGLATVADDLEGRIEKMESEYEELMTALKLLDEQNKAFERTLKELNEVVNGI